MKKFTKEEFDKLENSRGIKPTESMKVAGALVASFVESGEDIMEVEESDFDGEFKFDDLKQRSKAACKLRNVCLRSDFRNEDVTVKGKARRLFLVKASLFRRV